MAAWRRTRLSSRCSSQDEAEAEEFVRRTLGSFADADPVLRQTWGSTCVGNPMPGQAAAELFTPPQHRARPGCRAEQLSRLRWPRTLLMSPPLLVDTWIVRAAAAIPGAAG